MKARTLLEKGGEAVPVEVLNNIGVLHFEREELEVCADFLGFIRCYSILLCKYLFTLVFIVYPFSC